MVLNIFYVHVLGNPCFSLPLQILQAILSIHLQKKKFQFNFIESICPTPFDFLNHGPPLLTFPTHHKIVALKSPEVTPATFLGMLN